MKVLWLRFFIFVLSLGMSNIECTSVFGWFCEYGVSVFRRQLGLSPFTFGDFHKAILKCRKGLRWSLLLEEIHIVLIRFLAKERRSLDGKIHFYNHILVIDNTHCPIPPFAPGVITDEYLLTQEKQHH